MGKFKSELYDAYEKACNDYLFNFCQKHEFNYEPDMWVANLAGTVVCVADYYVSIEDIITDIEMDATEEEFFKWYDYCTDCGYAGLKSMNYESWLRGCPRHDEKVLHNLAQAGIELMTAGNVDTKEAEKIIESNPELKKLKEDLFNLIDE